MSPRRVGGLGNSNRVFGLSGSGIDVDEVVAKMMVAARKPRARLEQQQTFLGWKKNSYYEMNKAVTTFRNNNVFNFTLQKTLAAKNATSSVPGVASVIAGADAGNVSSVLQVLQLASGVTQMSEKRITPMGNSKSSLQAQFGITQNFDLVLNGQKITVDVKKSLNDLALKINKSSAGINASYDATADMFFLQTNDSGAKAQISYEGSSSAGLRFLTDQLALPTTVLTKQSGQNAKFSLNGTMLEQNSNNFTLNNLTFSLSGTGTTQVQVKNDTDKIIDNVKEFIKEYNAILTAASTQHGEKRNRNFLPLTDEQKTEMKDSEISAWTKKAQTGLLQRDQHLSKLMNGMRNLLSSRVEGISGKYTTASSIGITTGHWSEKGKLHLDEQKLRSALAEDPIVLYKLFGERKNTTKPTDKSNGLAIQLNEFLKTVNADFVKEGGITADTSEATSVIGKQYKLLNGKMINLDRKLQAMENHHYAKFSRMEKILARLNQQSARISSMIK